MVKLKIDPEFRDKIPALTEAEFEQLKENILSDGEVYEPIVTWNDTIIDGHNRWRIICENWEKLKDKYRVKPMEFENKYKAFSWMYNKQLGRRNLSDENKKYCIGKRNEAEKLAHGGDRKSRSKVDLEPNGKTAQKIADEYGIGYGTVVRAEKFAKGVDALREISQEAANSVLRGGSGASQAEIAELPNKTAQEIQKVAEDILSGEIKKPKSKPHPKEDVERRKTIERIVEDMYNPDSVPEFTIEFLLEDIQMNGAVYVDLLRNTLTDRSTLLTKDNKPLVADAIQQIIDKITKVKELVEK